MNNFTKSCNKYPMGNYTSGTREEEKKKAPSKCGKRKAFVL